jgi:osmotically-inducible protein OsmY
MMTLPKTCAFLGLLGFLSACAHDPYATERPTARTTETVPVYTSDVISAPPLQVNADLALTDSVRQQFNRYPSLSPVLPNVQVRANNGMVTLSGNVPTEQDRILLSQAVRETPGVLGINDNILVAPLPTGRATAATPGEIFSLHVQGLTQTDRALAQQILEGLRTDTTLATLLPKVDINVSGGKVTLNGNVQSTQQKRTIATVIERAAGAENVDNNLEVVPSP